MANEKIDRKDDMEEVVDSLDYRGEHVDFYMDDYGQQFYTVYDGGEISFGSYNNNYKEDMKYVIDRKLDVITTCPELQKEGIYGAELRWFDNGGWDDIKLTYKSRILWIYDVGRRDRPEAEEWIKEFICESISRLRGWKGFWKKEDK